MKDAIARNARADGGGAQHIGERELGNVMPELHYAQARFRGGKGVVVFDLAAHQGVHIAR